MVTSEEESLFQKVNVLDTKTWPSPLPLMYGECEIRELCTLLKIGFSGVKQSYRDFKENASVPMHMSLLELKNAVETIAVSSAECERGFSEMNAVVISMRSQLKTQNVSALMFIQMVGPPLTSWDPTKYVRKWVATRRSADHLACRQRCTTTQASPISPSGI